MAEEIKLYLSTSRKQIIYNRDEIQERNSVLCGYWYLYFLTKRQKGTSFLDTIHNPKSDPVNQHVNNHFLINYFSLLYLCITLSFFVI